MGQPEGGRGAWGTGGQASKLAVPGSPESRPSSDRTPATTAATTAALTSARSTIRMSRRTDAVPLTSTSRFESIVGIMRVYRFVQDLLLT